MDLQENQVWSYFAWVVKVPSVNRLVDGLNALGNEGWELVTSVTTVKSWLNLTGNDLVFVLKKIGEGHEPSKSTLASLVNSDYSGDVAY